MLKYLEGRLGQEEPFLICKVTKKDKGNLLLNPKFAYERDEYGKFKIVPFEIFDDDEEYDEDLNIFMYDNIHTKYNYGDLICGYLVYDYKGGSLGDIPFRLKNAGTIKLKKLSTIMEVAQGVTPNPGIWNSIKYNGVLYLAPTNPETNKAILNSKNKDYSDYTIDLLEVRDTIKESNELDYFEEQQALPLPVGVEVNKDVLSVNAFKNLDPKQKRNYITRTLFEGDAANLVYAEPMNLQEGNRPDLIKYKIKVICNNKKIVKPFYPFKTSFYDGIMVRMDEERKRLLKNAGLDEKSSFITTLLTKEGKGFPFDLDFHRLNPLVDLSDYEVLQALTIYNDISGKKWLAVNQLTQDAREELDRVNAAYKAPAEELKQLEDKLAETKKNLTATLAANQNKEDYKLQLEKGNKELEKEKEELIFERQTLEDLTNNLKQKNSVLGEKVNKLENEEKALSDKVEYLSRLKEQLQAYDVQLGQQTTVEGAVLPEQAYDGNFIEVVKAIRTSIYNHSENWNYSTSKIVNMLLGIYSGQLVLLVGNPGSGKTSFVQKFSKALGYKAGMIAVQSNWMDKADLLGYYNPLQKKFVPSTFTEILVDYIALAEKYSDRIFMLCLDEMNLSHIEYYFADFLSALQTEERMVSLYSNSVYNEAMAEVDMELKTTLEREDLSEIEKSRILKDCAQRKNNLLRYKSQLHIPENICFVGTLNQDDTTKDLSPKVIDRAYFLRMDEGEEAEDELECQEVPKEAYLKVKVKSTFEQEDYDTIIETMKRNGKVCKVLLNYRLNRLIKNITQRVDLSKEKMLILANDCILAAIVLPRLKIKITFSDNYPICRNIYEKYMLDGDEVSYWRGSL